ncbi:Mesoderm induction early response protein 1, partial [Stegodyphus mimosarum]
MLFAMNDENRSQLQFSTLESDTTFDFKNTKNHKIRIGRNYQAAIPTLKASTDNDNKIQIEGKLLWNPLMISEEETDHYLRSIYSTGCYGSTEEEKALFLLHTCRYNAEEALRRYSILPQISNTDLIWQDDEIQNFEEGLFKYGKDFHSIQVKLRTKSTRDIVEFYYYWKKSKRKNKFVSYFGNSLFLKEIKKKHFFRLRNRRGF